MEPQYTHNPIYDIAWHPGFVSAIKMEFLENDSELTYIDEKLLSQEPLKADLMVIKKTPNVMIKNELGRFFRLYNLIEYKSPDDAMGLDTLYKVIGYGCLYFNQEYYRNNLQPSDITLTMVRWRNPLSLLKNLKELGHRIENPCSGIYLITDGLLFPIQIIVERELNTDHHIWLSLLRYDLDKELLKKSINIARNINNDVVKPYRKALYSVVLRANCDILNALIEEERPMRNHLQEIFDEIEENKKKFLNEVEEHRKKVNEQSRIFAEKEAAFNKKEHEFSLRECELTQKEHDIAEKEKNLAKIELLLSKREQQLQQLEARFDKLENFLMTHAAS